MPTSLDLLMHKDPLELSAQDTDQIIAYHRKAREAAMSGVKAKKFDAAPKPDFVALGIIKAKPTYIKRKI